MRREFNDTIDIYNGTGGSAPGAFRGSFPGRIVFYSGRLLVTSPFDTILGYMTTNTNVVRAGQVVVGGGLFAINPGFGSFCVRQSDGYTFNVLYRERINPRHGPAYWRCCFTA